MLKVPICHLSEISAALPLGTRAVSPPFARHRMHNGCARALRLDWGQLREREVIPPEVRGMWDGPRPLADTTGSLTILC